MTRKSRREIERILERLAEERRRPAVSEGYDHRQGVTADFVTYEEDVSLPAGVSAEDPDVVVFGGREDN